MTDTGDIYSATYSNVPVYELKIAGDHVMRRRSDDWINATHILKIAGFDKPARTRILEREVQKGVHEKIQGGYGKYQGTWVPLGDGKALAEKHGIQDRLARIFEYVPGDRSPPPAPKHTTAASNRTKVPKPAPARKVQAQSYYRPVADHYDTASVQFDDDESQRELTPESASFLGDDDFLPQSQNSNGSRKRKRDAENAAFSANELEHTIYGDELLDYFVTAGDDPSGNGAFPPVPPANFEVNKAIDSHGNNALHWACAMGDVGVTRDLLNIGANPAAPNAGSGETPLIRAVLFTNNYDKQTFPKIVQALSGTITERDWHGATVFHHIAETARSRSKWSCARYYCEVLINKMLEMGSNYVQALLASTDKNHDTAVLCAVRNGCVKVASFLLNHCPEAGDVQNLKGETANEVLRALKEQRDSLEQPASSPLRPGETNSRKRARHNAPKHSSRAASTIMSRVSSIVEEESVKLANMYEAEMHERETNITEAKVSLSNFEAQRHKIRQESFTLMAKAEDDSKLNLLRGQYEQCLRETESLLEQMEHATLQNEVLQQDQQTPPHAFRSANSQPLSHQEMQATLPWAIELLRQQQNRRQLVQEIAKLMGDAGTSERVGKHRKLVAIATGLKEDELDAMSIELLESLEATQGSVGLDGERPSTPAHLVGVVA